LAIARANSAETSASDITRGVMQLRREGKNVKAIRACVAADDRWLLG
jgi:hypothetical protein